MFKSITRLRVGTVRRDGAAAVCGRRKLNALYRAPTASRHFATDASSTPPPHPTSTAPPPKGGIRISTLFYGLILIGVASTAFGLYELYQMFTMWPEELRSDLRAALRAKHDDNPKLSAKHFQKAYDAARALDIAKLGDEPYLKISGIALALADALERANRPSSAFDAYQEAYDLLRAHASALSDRERLRGAAVAHKLGELAAEYSLGDEEEERWRVAAVEDGLRVARAAAAGASANDSGDEENARVVLADLDLPRWLTAEDVGAPIEALGAFYARTGRVDWALALYLQAVSLLVPPEGSGKKGKPEDVCRGAQMMNNLSELILRGKLTPEKIHQAESWARKALAVIETTRGGAGYYADMSMCDQATVVTLFNLASIREMDSDNKSAKDLFKQALDKSAQIGYQDGAAHAQLALQRLARIERGATLAARAPPPSTNP